MGYYPANAPGQEELMQCPKECHIFPPSVEFNAVVSEEAKSMVVPFAGRIAAITVGTGRPTAAATAAADRAYGNPSFRLAVLAPTSTAGSYVLSAVGQLQTIKDNELGFSATQAIPPVEVSPGEVAALAVPTWLPAISQLEPEGRQATQLSTGPTPCGISVAPAGSWEPAIHSTLTFGCSSHNEAVYGVTLISNTLQPVPRYAIRLHVVSARRGALHRRVLDAVTISGLSHGEHASLRCQAICYRFARTPHHQRAGRGSVTFSGLSVTLGRPNRYLERVKNLVFLEVSARAPGHLTREDLLGVSTSGRYSVSEICLLPGVKWFAEEEFDDVVSCEG
jgi:hypothetical protein